MLYGKPKCWRQTLLAVLVLPIIGWTIFATWAAARVSTFIIYSDEVYKRMMNADYWLELRLASVIHQLRGLGLVAIITGVWVLFLVLLWRCFQTQTQTASEAGSNLMNRVGQYCFGEEMRCWRPVLLAGLALPLIGWTILATWSGSCLSTFIVTSAATWTDCGSVLHLAEAIHHLESLGLIPVVTTMAILFLVLLWRSFRTEISRGIRALTWPKGWIAGEISPVNATSRNW
jgi:hypothetical protein